MFSFNGRATRSVYWASQIIYGVIYAITMVGVSTENVTMMTGGLMIMVIGFVPVIGIQVKRFHDLNKTGFMVLINLIPYIGGFITLGMLGFMGPVNTDENTNMYGPDPRTTASE